MSKKWSTIEIEDGINQANLDDSQFKYIKGFEVLRINEGKAHEYEKSQYETGILILEGTCNIDVEDEKIISLGSRQSVFEGLPSAVYIPIDTKFSIKSDNALVGICRGICDKKTELEIITEDKIKVMQVGKDNWSREVRMIIGQDSNSVNLLMGETLNPPGNWSGTPPHKHEGVNVGSESTHEELYYFKTEKQQGWGIQRLYSDEKSFNDLIYLKENVVTFMPYGYHQIVAGPGYNLYYLFFLSGEGKNLMGYEDPDHNWIKN